MNYQDIFHLITIAEKSLQWPQLASIHKAAIKELEGIAADIMNPPDTSPIDEPVEDSPIYEPSAEPVTAFTSDEPNPRRL